MSTKFTDLESMEQIIKEMTLEEKAEMVMGSSGFRSRGNEKYGIPEAVLLDGGTGFNSMQWGLETKFQEIVKKAEEKQIPIDAEKLSGMGGLGVAFAMDYLLDEKEPREDEKEPELGCYPPGMFLGATWNPEPIEACGHSLGREMNKLGVDVVLGTPNVNIHRDPLNGRLFEGYSEDPCLVSKLAPAFVKGVQAEGVIANVKHFAANSQEKDRMGVNEIISERALREIYFPGFRSCVDAGCKSVMSAYNKINGEPCAMNRWLLTDVLRGDWGFDGFVVSDWSASYDQVISLAAGNDLIMPGPRGKRVIVDAVKKGILPEAKLDECLRNWLKILLKAPVMRERVKEFDVQQAVDAAEFAAREGITLLQNDGTLPLKGQVKIAYYGKRSKDFAGSGAGSAEVATCLMTNPLDSTAERMGKDQVTFGKADEDTKVWIVTVGANGQEGADRPNMEMDEDDKEALETAIAEAAKADGKVILLLNTCGPVTLMDYKDRVNAIVCAYYPGMRGGKVFTDILFGDVNPSGKLPLSWPKYYRDCPSFRNFGGEAQEVFYGEGIYVGYRYYDMKHVEPLYPFGYGLSYTTFQITGAQVRDSVNVDEEDVKVSVTVKNTGEADGSEVVQLYIHDVISRQEKPDKELKAFQKVFVKAGQEETVTLTLEKKDFASWSAEIRDWATEPGEYELRIGNSSANIQVTKLIDVKCKNPFGLGELTSVGEVVSHEEAVKMIQRITGLDLMKRLNTCIVFFPQMIWKEVWGPYLGDVLRDEGKTEAEVEGMYREILAGFARLNE